MINTIKSNLIIILLAVAIMLSIFTALNPYIKGLRSSAWGGECGSIISDWYWDDIESMAYWYGICMNSRGTDTIPWQTDDRGTNKGWDV
jgi:hypothetical protein